MGFVEGRVNPSRTMVQVNAPVNADQPEWVCFSEDVFTMATQAATHWDALAHMQLRRGDLQRLPGVDRLGGGRRPLRHPPPHHRGQPGRPARRGPRPRA